jgi:Methyltransferase domain
VIYSCVVDPQPKFVHQLEIWTATLTQLAGVEPSRILVHVLDGDYRAEAVALLDARAIAHRPLARFGDGRFCNKIAQLRDPGLPGDGYVALCDTDIAFCAPLEPFAAGAVSAKVVDLPNPSLAALEETYRRAGFTRLPPLTRCSNADAHTFANNCNGGVYLLRRDVVRALAPRWEHWALWLLGETGLLEDDVKHADQIAFGLATWELGIAILPLPLAANFPTHLPPLPAASAEPPAALHYHDRIGADGLLLRTGIPHADERIASVNETIARARRAGFDNARFWNFRYAEHPELGSGLGSRGRNAHAKRKLLLEALAETAPASVLDVGCGDLTVTGDLPLERYVGLDVSAEAVRIARARRPDWRFVVGDLLETEVPAAETVLCFDVLIHERDPGRYRAAVARLAALAERELIVGAYNQPPWLRSAMAFYHEPITATLLASGAFSLEIIGGYRDTTVVRATRLHDDRLLGSD